MKKFPIIILLLAMIQIITACTLPTEGIGDLIATLIPADNSIPVVCPTCEPCVICETPVVITVEPTSTEVTVSTETPTEEPAELPALTETPTATATNVTKPTATDVVFVVYQYILQPGSPAYINNVFHPADGDNWMGIGGQVFNSHGEPQPLVVVHVDGVFEGIPVELVSMTGVARYLGPEGYEVELADHGIDSEGSLTITLFDLAGNQISAAYAFDTFSALSKAQIIINFIQNN